MFIRLSTLFIVFSLSVSAQTLHWAKQFGPGDGEGQSVAVDEAGNVYTTGYFEDTLDFDPGPNELLLAPAGDGDIFVCKQDLNGNLIWARHVGTANPSTTFEWGNEVKVDNTGNVYVVGNFDDGTADFDPGPGTADLYASDNDAFVLKLDPMGNFLWALDIGGSGNDRGNDAALDADGNLYVAGAFFNTVHLTVDSVIESFPSAGSGDMYVCKIDPTGNVLWFKRIGGAQNDAALGFALDPDGNALLHGEFSGTADFDPGPGIYNLTSAGSLDLVTVKLDPSGALIWAKQFESSDTTFEWGLAIAADIDGNVYCGGYFRDTCDFDPGSGVHHEIVNGTQDAYVCKLDENGNFQWVRRIGGTGYDVTYSIATTPQGNVIAAGTVENGFLYTGTDSISLTTGDQQDIFLIQLDTDGNPVSTFAFGGGSYDASRDVTVDSDGTVYVTGFFNDTADFDPGPGTSNLIGSGNPFVVKLTPGGVNAIPKINGYDAIVYPNPTTGGIVCDLDKEYRNIDVTVTNLIGQIVYTEKIENSRQVNFSLDVASGIYCVEVNTGADKPAVFKIVVE